MDYSLWSSTILRQNCDRDKKSFQGHRLKALFMLTTMVQPPTSYLMHTPIPSAVFSSKSIPNTNFVHWSVLSEMARTSATL